MLLFIAFVNVKIENELKLDVTLTKFDSRTGTLKCISLNSLENINFFKKDVSIELRYVRDSSIYKGAIVYVKPTRSLNNVAILELLITLNDKNSFKPKFNSIIEVKFKLEDEKLITKLFKSIPL